MTTKHCANEARSITPHLFRLVEPTIRSAECAAQYDRADYKNSRCIGQPVRIWYMRGGQIQSRSPRRDDELLRCRFHIDVSGERALIEGGSYLGRACILRSNELEAQPKGPGVVLTQAVQIASTVPPQPRRSVKPHTLSAEELEIAVRERIAKMPEICAHPLILPPGIESRRLWRSRPRPQRASHSQWQGDYPSFEGKVRVISVLSEVTIHELARSCSHYALLESNASFAARDFAWVAKTASRGRNDRGIFGRFIKPYTAEFYLRLFRALRLTRAEIEKLSANQLGSLVLGAINNCS